MLSIGKVGRSKEILIRIHSTVSCDVCGKYKSTARKLVSRQNYI
jgi:hypothetical protein